MQHSETVTHCPAAIERLVGSEGVELARGVYSLSLIEGSTFVAALSEFV